MTTIYVVQGVSWAQDCSQTWIVCAYAEQARAEQHAAQANDFGQRGYVAWTRDMELVGRGELSEDEYMERTYSNPLDENMQLDFGGIEYCVIPVELCTEAPE